MPNPNNSDAEGFHHRNAVNARKFSGSTSIVTG
jgi:hypothetical protein